MERTADYWMFAEHHGWTPDQVDRLPLWYRQRLPAIWQINAEIQEARTPKPSRP